MEKEEIRLVDLFESVMERPYLYTLTGSYLEAVAYLEGCQNALVHKYSDASFPTDVYTVGVDRYERFKEWLLGKDGYWNKEAMAFIPGKYDDALEAALLLYQEFKIDSGIT